MTKLTDKVTYETSKPVTNYEVTERIMQQRFRELCKRQDGVTELYKQGINYGGLPLGI